jgi:hypothetical protein
MTTTRNVLQQSNKTRSLPIAGFYSTNILILSSCIVLENNTNYKNLPWCPDFLMNE